jgi:mono/diheme cytochrome c family protein
LLEELGRNESKRSRSAAMAGLMGRELEAINLIAAEKTLFADTPSNRTTLTEIVDHLLAEKNVETNMKLIEFTTKPIVKRPWQSEVVMHSILQYLEKNKTKQLKLNRAAFRWQQFQSNPPADMVEQVVQIDNKLWWPSRTDIVEFVPAQVDKTVANLIMRGKKVYNICKTCHQVNGMGTPPTYPPLSGSEFVTGDQTRLIKILLHGVTGPMIIDSVTYSDHMPPAPVKSDYDIAAVITYVRQAWKNKEDAVYPSDVKNVRSAFKGRKAMWTVEEFSND